MVAPLRGPAGLSAAGDDRRTPRAEPPAQPTAAARRDPAARSRRVRLASATPRARARGLAAPYIAGGRDPDPEAGRREERYYLRLLLIMVVVIVLGGFVLGILANVIDALG